MLDCAGPIQYLFAQEQLATLFTFSYYPSTQFNLANRLTHCNTPSVRKHTDAVVKGQRKQ